jgi:hypothetical protein
MAYNVGDLVNIRVYDEYPVPSDAPEFTGTVEVRVIYRSTNYDYTEFGIYIPSFIKLRGTRTLTDRWARDWKIDPKFVGEQVYFISSRFIHSLSRTAIARCAHCGESGDSYAPQGFTCHSCRMNPHRPRAAVG